MLLHYHPSILVDPLCWIRLKHFSSQEVYVSGTVGTELVFTVSQNSWGWKGLLEGIWSNSLLKLGQVEPIPQDHVQMAFDYLQGRRLLNLSEASLEKTPESPKTWLKEFSRGQFLLQPEMSSLFSSWTARKIFSHTQIECFC